MIYDKWYMIYIYIFIYILTSINQEQQLGKQQ